MKSLKLSIFCALLLFSKILSSQCPSTFSISNYTVNAPQWGIVNVDFNGDSNVDIATANFSNNCVSLYYGSANGTFTTITNYTTNLLAPIQIKSADFNGDGKSDLVMTNNNPYSDQLSVMLNLGNSSFGPASNYTINSNAFGIDVADFNSDGKKDVVATCGNGFQLLTSLGNGSFSPPVTFTTSGSPRYLVSNDFNGDGKPDLAVPDLSNTITILLGTGTGSFNVFVKIPTATNHLIVSSDFNNDGKKDFMVNLNPYTTGNLVTYLGTGNGGFVLGPTYLASVINNIAVGDFNADGLNDFVITKGSGYADIVMNTGTSFIFNNSYNTMSYLRDAVVDDFNKDGRVDFASSNGHPSSTFASVFLNTYSLPNYTVNVTSSSSIICAGETATLTAKGAKFYSWSTSQSDSTIIVTPTVSTIYSVVGYSAQCAVATNFQQKVVACTGINEQGNTSLNSIKLFPNPNNGIVDLDFGILSENTSLELYSSTGQLLFNSIVVKDHMTINTEAFSPGIYFIKINESGRYTGQIKMIKN